MTSDLLAPDDLLQQTEPVDAILCSLYSDERPLRGSLASFDWRLKGVVSQFLKAGHITGNSDELVFIPFTRQGLPKGLLLLGLGPNQQTDLPIGNKAQLEKMKDRLVKLKMTRIAISVSAFPVKRDELAKVFKNFQITWVQ